MTLKRYLASLPERLVRSVVGLGAGVAREVGDVALPKSVRESRLYQNLVDTTLRFLIEQVGGVEGVYGSEQKLAENFLARRTVGNAVEALGIVAFRASPVWVLAALADVCGLGRHLIPEIAASLKTQGLLDADTEFTSVDQLLDGLERTSARLAQTINTPPLDVASLRQEWRAIREEARSLAPERLPSGEALTTFVDRAQDRVRAAGEVDLRDLVDAGAVCGACAAAGRAMVGSIGGCGRHAIGPGVGGVVARAVPRNARRGPAGWLHRVRDAAAAPVRACGRIAFLTGEVHADRAFARSPREEVFIKEHREEGCMNRRLRLSLLVCAVLASAS